ncbi:MAG: hypothetical protein AB1921_04400 [Thermodesulfobacteriota bacterium]
MEKSRIVKKLLTAALMEDRPGLKRPVAARMASRIGEYMLWWRPTSLPFVHELGTLSAWWANKMGKEAIYGIRDIACDYIINGRIVPIQNVWKDILNSPVMFIGHCVCRSSGLANDLYGKDGQVVTLSCDEDNQILLGRLMDRYDSLVRTYGYLPDTDDKYVEFFRKLARMRNSGLRLENFLELTYPSWEFLPVVPGYTQSWIRGMHANRKAHQIHKLLAFEIANIFYVSRGTMFTSMKCVDTPYTICSCPTPDLGGGCALSNWYYYGHSNTSILPNESCFGRRRDEDGNLMPCNIFPERGVRECMGCGCKHGDTDPRGIETVLNQADEMLQKMEALEFIE